MAHVLMWASEDQHAAQHYEQRFIWHNRAKLKFHNMHIACERCTWYLFTMRKEFIDIDRTIFKHVNLLYSYQYPMSWHIIKIFMGK